MSKGYAVGFNMRHNRQGHLFQNRYKSILCQEEPFLLELVRYIHLNPLHAGLVKTYEKLCSYPYCGQSVILGKRKREWQDADYVLGLFDNRHQHGSEKGAELVKEDNLSVEVTY